MAASVKHSALSNEQYTPSYIVEPAREVLGHFDLDPASSEIANRCVRAEQIFTAADGERTFEEDWFGRVFLNPPGGQKLVLKGSGQGSNPAIFWAKLMYEWWHEENVEAAIFVGFTMEVLGTTQSVERFPLAQFPLCFPKTRICFDALRVERIEQLEKRLSRTKKEKDQLALKSKIAELQASSDDVVSGGEPPHGNVIALVPPREERHTGHDTKGRPWVSWGGPTVDKFQDVFSEVGYVRIW